MPLYLYFLIFDFNTFRNQFLQIKTSRLLENFPQLIIYLLILSILQVVLAPAMVYKEMTVICGHSIEINFVSDIIINLSLQQIRLLSCLLMELEALVEPLQLDDELRPKITLPYSKSEDINYEIDENEINDICKDSGIDTSDVKSIISSKRDKILIESEKYPYQNKSLPLHISHNNIPLEMLVTAGKINFGIYQVDVEDFNRQWWRRRSTKKSLTGFRRNSVSSAAFSYDIGYDAEEEDMDDSEGKKLLPLVSSLGMHTMKV